MQPDGPSYSQTINILPAPTTVSQQQSGFKMMLRILSVQKHIQQLLSRCIITALSPTNKLQSPLHATVIMQVPGNIPQ